MSYLTARADGLYFEGVSLAELAERFGTPTYVYSRAAITQAYDQYARALGIGRGRSVMPLRPTLT